MSACVLPRGVIAATHVPTLQADAQVQPDPALTQAVLAAVDRGRQLCDGDRVEMTAGGHCERMTRARGKRLRGSASAAYSDSSPAPQVGPVTLACSY